MKVHIAKKLTLEEENKQLREALAELQEREKQRDESYKPRHDLAE